MSLKSFEIEDGAHEVVDERPERDRLPVADVTEIAGAVPGGRMAHMRAAGDDARRRFLLVRSQEATVKMALAHVPVFRALDRAYLSRRAAGAEDPFVSLAEIEEMTGTKAPRNVLDSLVKNGAVKRRTTFTGWQGARAAYAPTTLGRRLIATAEEYGEGTLIQLGGLTNAWKGRNQTEPPTIFQFADLIKRGLALENPG